MRLIKSPMGALLLVIAVCLLMTGIFQACRKVDTSRGTASHDPNIARFLTVGPNADTLVKVIAALIRRQHEKRGTINTLIKNAGFPIWEKARISSKDAEDGKQVFIPVARDGERQTSAVIMVKIKGGDTLFRLLYPSHYDDYGFDGGHGGWDGPQVARIFMAFDFEVFGHKEFFISDSRLVGQTASPAVPVKVKIDMGDHIMPPGRLQTVWNITSWMLYIRCGSCDQPARQLTEACCNATYEWHMVMWWYDDSDDDWGWYAVNPEEVGGAGPCPGCNWEDTNPCDVEPPYEDLCDPNWQPMPGTPYNPFLYDSVIVEDGLETAYPCIASLIKDSINNANWIAQLAGNNIFGEQMYTHITFDTSTTHTTENQAPGYTIPEGDAYYDDNGHFHINLKVYLNGWYLRNSAHEYNIGTIVHEAMHSVIVTRWAQYQRWLTYGQGNIDSNYLKEKFPIHWAFFSQQFPYTPSEVNQHILMANEYLDEWMSIGRQYYNPNAPTAVRDSVLKAAGQLALMETSYWKLLPSQGYDTCKVKRYDLTAIRRLDGSFSHPGCPNFTINYATDLYLRNPCQ